MVPGAPNLWLPLPHILSHATHVKPRKAQSQLGHIPCSARLTCLCVPAGPSEDQTFLPLCTSEELWAFFQPARTSTAFPMAPGASEL